MRPIRLCVEVSLVKNNDSSYLTIFTSLQYIGFDWVNHSNLIFKTTKNLYILFRIFEEYILLYFIYFIQDFEIYFIIQDF